MVLWDDKKKHMSIFMVESIFVRWLGLGYHHITIICTQKLVATIFKNLFRDVYLANQSIILKLYLQ